MTQALRFVSWGKGELSPQVRGRVDVQQYYSSAESLKNCLVRPYGNVINRAGSRFVKEVKDSTKTTRLLKFVFNVSESYAVEMGEYYFRFYTDGAILTLSATPGTYDVSTTYELGEYVSYDDGSGADNYYCLQESTGDTPDSSPTYWYELEDDIVEIPHTYTEDELFDVQYAQKDDVVKLTHGQHKPAELKRLSADVWTKSDIDIVGGPFQDLNTTDKKLKPNAVTGDTFVTCTTGEDVFTPDMIGNIIHFSGIKTGEDYPGYARITSLDATNPTTKCFVTVERDIDDTDTRVGWAFGAWHIADYTATTYAGGTTYDAGDYATYDGNDYYSLAAANSGNTPDPDGHTAWWFKLEGTVDENPGYPAVVTFYESRLVFGRSSLEPQKEWMSRSFIFDDFTAGSDSDDGISYTLNTEQANDIKWVSSGNSLATGTFGGEFITSSGSGNEALAPDNINARRQNGWGSKAIQPKKISNFIYYVQRGGRKIRELYYYFDYDNYESVDMTEFSEHITLSGIVDMDYQQNPDSQLWCVKDNGDMCVLTRNGRTEVQAWTPIETDGEYKSVVVIPNDTNSYDEVWVIVDRDDSQYVEYFGNHIVEDDTQQYNLFYVDSGISYNSFGLTAGITLEQTTNVPHTDNWVYETTADAFVAGDVGKNIVIVDSSTRELLITVNIISYTNARLVVGTVSPSGAHADATGGNWGIEQTTMDGLDHLEGESVSVLEDGIAATNKTVSSGEITFDNPSWIACAGLPYESVLKTNPLNAQTPTGTGKGKIKRINEIALSVYKTLGISVGSVESNLQDVTPPSTESQTELYTGDLPNIMFRGAWDYTGYIIIKQENPYPMNILGIYPKVQISDKA